MLNHENVVVVESTEALFSYRRNRGENIVLLPRPISGNFNELAKWLLSKSAWRNVLVADKSHYLETAYKNETLEEFKSDPAMTWSSELSLICQDMQQMQDILKRRAELRIVRDRGYATGTYCFHQDGGEYSVAFNGNDRVMCCYNAPTTEWIRKDDAIALPAGKGFHTFEKRSGAPVFRFAIGDIWRQACMGGGGEALIHRAVETGPDQPPRLLVVC